MPSTKKKLCFILPKYQANDASHFSYVIELVLALKQDQDVFLLLEKGDVPDFFPKGDFYLQKFRFLPLRWLENLSVILWVYLRGYRDFYIHYSFLSAFNASLAVKFLGGRTFYWNCGLPWLYKRNFLRENFERLVYKSVTFLVTGTEGLKKEYARHYRLPLDKIKVLPNGINLKRFNRNEDRINRLRKELNLSEGWRVILFIHHLSRRKGAPVLSKIAESLKEEKTILVVVGDGPEKARIEKRIEDSGLKDRVRFRGYAPNREIADYLGLADIFIMPSEEEGFPHVVLEAMAMGVPFVAFAVGGVKEIAPPEFLKYVLPSGDVSGFVGKIKELLRQSQDQIRILSQQEQDWVKQFDLAAVLDKFKNLILN